MAAKQRVTLKLLAERAGCSIASVSTVLNGAKGNTGVGEDTRSRIMSIAKKLGYRPNFGARMMKKRSSGVVGVVIKSEALAGSAEGGASEFVEGIGEELEAAGKVMSLVQIPWDYDTRSTDARALKEQLLDGMVVVSAAPQSVVDIVRNSAEATVYLDTNHWAATDCIRRNERAAGRTAVRELAERGYRRLIYLTRPVPKLKHYSFAERATGVKAAASKLGIPVETVEAPWPGLAHDTERAECYARLEGMFGARTALVAGNGGVAMEFVGRCAMSRTRVGVDVGLACCDSTEFLSRLAPDLARVSFDRRAMGARAAQMVLGKLERPRRRIESELVEGTWVAGASAPGPNA
jgi:LacI family transcriptional regulator